MPRALAPFGMDEAALEKELLLRARSGERRAFDALVRAHFERVYRVLFRMVGNHEDAEDLAQESFVRAYRALRHFRGEGSFPAWLLSIALHLARDHQRRRGRSARVYELAEVGEVETGRAGPAQEVSRKELARSVSEEIAELPPALRSAFVLRVIEGMEYDDVARAMGVRPGTARTQVMKARRLLMGRMRRWLEGRAR